MGMFFFFFKILKILKIAFWTPAFEEKFYSLQMTKYIFAMCMYVL